MKQRYKSLGSCIKMSSGYLVEFVDTVLVHVRANLFQSAFSNTIGSSS